MLGDLLQFTKSRITVKDLTKYLLEGIVIAVALLVIPQRKLPVQAVISVAVTAGLTFLVLDLAVPSVAENARMGAGLVVGLKMVGGGPMPLDEETEKKMDAERVTANVSEFPSPAEMNKVEIEMIDNAEAMIQNEKNAVSALEVNVNTGVFDSVPAASA